MDGGEKYARVQTALPLRKWMWKRHLSVFALCLGPFEDLVSLKTNSPLIWRLQITEKIHQSPFPLSFFFFKMLPLESGRLSEGREDKGRVEKGQSFPECVWARAFRVCNQGAFSLLVTVWGWMVEKCIRCKRPWKKVFSLFISTPILTRHISKLQFHLGIVHQNL